MEVELNRVSMGHHCPFKRAPNGLDTCLSTNSTDAVGSRLSKGLEYCPEKYSEIDHSHAVGWCQLGGQAIEWTIPTAPCSEYLPTGIARSEAKCCAVQSRQSCVPQWRFQHSLRMVIPLINFSFSTMNG